MKNPSLKSNSAILTTMLFSAMALHCNAATIVWGGTSGEYTTPGNWLGGNLPNTAGGDTAQINAGAVTYTPGGDLTIQNGGSLEINGGSWTQAGGNAFIQLAGGKLVVNGGAFSQGSAGQIVRNANTQITVSGGVANFNDNLIYETMVSGSISILSSGSINVANEFKPISTFSMTSGSLTANLISFADGPGTIDFSGGLISVNGAGVFSGFYVSGTNALNFTTGSTGSLFFRTYTLGELNIDGFLNNGTIKLDGMASASSFNAFEADGGVYVSLASVPEPSSSMLLLGALGVLLLNRRRG